MSFILPDWRLAHLIRHFGANDLAGSYFLPEVFATPTELVDFINAHPHTHSIDQGNGRMAFHFETSDKMIVGTCGLARREEVDAGCILREQREGYTLEIGYVESLPFTHEFCVIADRREYGFHIITAFPGGYARPFAQKSQPREEYELNKKFWEEHVLLKQKNTMQ
jgi:hypothetical protein